MGEPSKVILLEKVIEVIKRDKLIENVKVTGSSVNFLFFPLITKLIENFIRIRGHLVERTQGFGSTVSQPGEKRPGTRNVLRIRLRFHGETGPVGGPIESRRSLTTYN
jgi:hypothetical protein